jgi:hypothetical protein
LESARFAKFLALPVRHFDFVTALQMRQQRAAEPQLDPLHLGQIGDVFATRAKE